MHAIAAGWQRRGDTQGSAIVGDGSLARLPPLTRNASTGLADARTAGSAGPPLEHDFRSRVARATTDERADNCRRDHHVAVHADS